MTTYHPIDRRPADPPTLRLSVVLGALVAGLALLLVLAIAHSTAGTVGDGMERGREIIRSGGTTADRIAELDATYGANQ